MSETAHSSHARGEIGAFYTTTRVQEVLGGVSFQTLSDRVEQGLLLRLRTDDGVDLFPSFQFAATALAPGLSRVLPILLASGADGWTVAYWLTAKSPGLGGTTALEALATGEPDLTATVEQMAANDAAGWNDQ